MDCTKKKSIWRHSCLVLAIMGTILAVLSLQGCQFLGRRSAEDSILTTPNPCLVLALPQTGPYAPFASKIIHGATLASKELAARGTSIRLENINTEAPDWLQKLQELPPSCALVGGPLQDSKYIEAKKANLLSQRAFFAFLPTLQQGEEGVSAWRFFPSQQDQVDALVNFATDELNIRSFGAFFPEDNYGRRMTQLFENTLKNKQMPLQKASYNPKMSATWAGAARPLINPTRSPSGRNVVPQTMFEAVFLPDYWKNIDGVTRSFRANGEDRLVLMGTALWENGLAGKQVPAAERYALAIFPAVWNKAHAPKSIADSGDFWTALGYDFVNFGAMVGLAMRPDALSVTALARKASPAIKGMAPIYWDETGKANQHLYLFQITPAGMSPLNKTRLMQQRTAIAERTALRMNDLDNPGPIINETQTPAKPQYEPDVNASSSVEPAVERRPPISRPASAPEIEPANREAPIKMADEPAGHMSNVPISTHKLSLPVKKQGI